MKRREFLRGLLGSAALVVLAGKREPAEKEPIYATLEVLDCEIEELTPWPPHEFDVSTLEVRDV